MVQEHAQSGKRPFVSDHPQQMVFADQVELFPIARSAGCIRLEIGTCLAPCAGACSRRDYTNEVRAAQSFLTGADVRALAVLEKQMAEASAARQFERAAEIRDKCASLRWLHGHLERLRQARERHSFIYPAAGSDGKEIWYAIHGGRTVAAIARPVDPAASRAAAKTIKALFRSRAVVKGILPPDQVDGFMLIASWFRRYPQEKKRVLTPAAALDLCRAGAVT